jgi:hypothetical protein
VIKITTPKGTLVIETSDPDVEVTVRKDGAVIVDKTKQREIELRVSEGYTIELAEKKDGLRLSTDRFTITKDGKSTVKVYVEKPKDVAKPKEKPAAGEPATLVVSGTSALSFDGKTTHVLVPSLVYEPGKAYTFEAWVKYNDAVGGHHIVTRVGDDVFGASLFRDGGGWYGFAAWSDRRILYEADTGLKCKPAWTHLAGVVDGKTVQFYLNGKRQPHDTSRPMSGQEVEGQRSQTKLMVLGSLTPIVGQPLRQPFAGVMDEMRVSKVVRYDKDFTPETRFEPDKDTLALYHCDEGQGDTLTDSSGNKHHGKIVGGTWVK